MATEFSWDEIKKENVDLVRFLQSLIRSRDLELLKICNNF